LTKEVRPFNGKMTEFSTNGVGLIGGKHVED
jgi:hypothetical protein